MGPLAGVPFVVKDNIDVADEVTACGSRAHDRRPATADAPVVARLRAAGGVLLGRATMDELAMGAATSTSATGPAFNPWQPAHSPGGSSGGCAVAVAAGLAPISVGTDTGGSIREPAAQCGVTGLAPTPDAVPMDGVAPFATGFDRVGPLARDPGDAALALHVMCGQAPPPGAVASPAGLRIGVVDELAGHPNRPGVLAVHAEMLARFRAAGAEVVDVSVPDARTALRVYSSLTAVAALPHIEPFVATGRAGAEVRRRHQLGRALRDDPGRLTEAQALRRALCAQVAGALSRVRRAALPDHADHGAAARPGRQPDPRRPAVGAVHRLLDGRREPRGRAGALVPGRGGAGRRDARRRDAHRTGRLRRVAARRRCAPGAAAALVTPHATGRAATSSSRPCRRQASARGRR